MLSCRLAVAALALVAAVWFAPAAAAQATCGVARTAPTSCEPAGTQITTTVQRMVYLSITSPSFSLTTPTNADFTGGGTTTKTDLGAQVVTVRANAAWTITIRGAAWTGTGNNAKLVTDLNWTSNGGGAWNAMTSSAVSLASGTATAGTGTTVGYRTAWSLTSDRPGTYSMALTFTVSAP